MRDQKLFTNKEMMLRNFKEVIDNLSDAESYITDVVNGKRQGNSDLGRMLDDAMGQFSTDDMEYLEKIVASNFEDALMINSLARLQQNQLRISEKLNNIFAESFNTSNNNNTITSNNANQSSTNRQRKWTVWGVQLTVERLTSGSAFNYNADYSVGRETNSAR